jgi:hypothetical protein
MLVIDININRRTELLSVGAVRIFPVYPYEPRKNKLCLYKCGEVVDGKLNPDTIFYIWYKYGCGIDLSFRVIKGYMYTKKYGYTTDQYSGPEQRQRLDSYDPIHDNYNYAGRKHRLDVSLQLPGGQQYWAIAGEYFFTHESFTKELRKYEIKPVMDISDLIETYNNKKHKGC